MFEAADARADDKHRRQRDPAADAVHHGGAREIDEAEALQPAFLPGHAKPTPGPMAEYGVDRRRQHQRGQKIAAEAHALGDRTGDDGGGRAAECHLEEEERHQPGAARPVKRAGIEHEIAGADDPAEGRPEHQAEADSPEGQRGHAEISHVLDGDIDGVLGPHETRLKTGESRLHQQHQNGAHQKPDRIVRDRRVAHTQLFHHALTEIQRRSVGEEG